MNIITLTTDLGHRDPYLAIVKAKFITSGVPNNVVDLSTGLKENNISDAAYILRNALQYFPQSTIHLVAVKFIADRSRLNGDSHVDNSRYLLASYKDQFIITPDNGLFTLIDPEFSEPVYQLYYEDQNHHHFFLKDVFADAALHILNGKPVSDIGTLTTDYYKAFQFESFVNGNILRGKGIYIDDFGNIVTNITRQKFAAVVGNKNFTISLPGERFDRIYNSYEDVKYGSTLVLFNTFGYLEVAANGKSAYNMLCPRDVGAKFDFNLLIEFYD
jgi:S-adenosyl-L-methionine hydrolase (adenosine-forming)